MPSILPVQSFLTLAAAPLQIEKLLLPSTNENPGTIIMFLALLFHLIQAGVSCGEVPRRHAGAITFTSLLEVVIGFDE